MLPPSYTIQKERISMPCTETYKEHIEYTFNAFYRIVILYAAINAWRDRNRRRQREISFEYLTEEKAVEKAIAALADTIPLEAIQPPHSSQKNSIRSIPIYRTASG